jgi:hypothetical protein
MNKTMTLEEFGNALDELMTKAGDAGISASDIESTMVEYSGYARMYTSGVTPEHCTRKIEE